MAPQEIETILARQLASYLAMPIFIVDPQGTLIFYNEHAEVILGRRFEETGEMPVDEWSIIFEPTNAEGAALPPDKLPINISRTEQRPAHGSFWINGLDNVPHHIEVTSFPLIGQADRHLGAVAIFWESGQP